MTVSRRNGIAGIGLVALSALVTATSPAPINANPPVRSVRAPQMPAHRSVAQDRQRVRPRAAASPCASNYGVSGDFFVGVTKLQDVAASSGSAVLGGESNDACDEASAIAGGESNDIGNDGFAQFSFIGSGNQNGITGGYAFDGAGASNYIDASYAAVVAGYGNYADGGGSFVGAGGNATQHDGEFSNVASGVDSFVGGGDLNQITSNGSGSFIGGGGYSYAGTNAKTAGNTISATDAFIGAGDLNTVSGPQGFVGAGSQNNATGNDAFVGAGVVNNASGGSSFAGAGFDNTASGGDAFVGAGGGEYFSKRGAGGTVDNLAQGEDSFVGAGDLNWVTGNGSVIGGGGYTYASTGAVKAGNSISATDAFIGAGDSNTIAGSEGFIGSGGSNAIGSKASYASIMGGNKNAVSGEYGSVIGGYGNTASGAYAIVAGGNSDTAAGELSFAAGYHAEAAHSGSFVWSDYSSGSATIKDTVANEFVVRASGGTKVYSNEGATTGVSLAAGSGTWASLSDRNAKTDIVPLDDASVLAKVATLPVSTWRYKTERGVRHAGPMAQDFYAAFGVGEDNRHITSIDEDGVALAAIKALHRENALLRARLAASQAARLASEAQLTQEMHRLEASVAGDRGK